MKNCRENSLLNRTIDQMLSGIFENSSQDDLVGDSTLREIASENIIDGNIGAACTQMKSLIYDTFKGVDCCSNEQVVYRFYNISNAGTREKIIQQILDGEICLSKLNFNDALDPLLSVYVNRKRNLSGVRKRWFGCLYEAISNFRICSLCPEKVYINKIKKETIYHQLMWAHYADCHRGICVKYNIKTDILPNNPDKESFCFLDNVRYQDKNIDIDSLTLNDALLMKSSQWSYEQEKRLVYYSSNVDDDYFPVKNVEIKAVYAGVRMPNGQISELKRAFKDSNIPLYKMSYDDNNIMNLKVNNVFKSLVSTKK